MRDLEPISERTVRTSARPRVGADERTDAELLDVAAGDPRAFGEFYLRHGHRLFAYFRPRCGDAQDAYDLVSETFAQAIAALGTFDVGRGEPAAWLFGIAKNKYRHYARRGAVETRARERIQLGTSRLAPDALDSLDEVIDLQDVRRRLAPAITQLPSSLADAVQLRCLDELSYDEVAQTLGIKAAAARKRVSRGLEQLEDLLPPNPFLTHD